MQSSHIFVLSIIALCLGYAVFEKYMKQRTKQSNKQYSDESDRMLSRIEVLEDRVRVLEKIVTDPRESLSQKINDL